MHDPNGKPTATLPSCSHSRRTASFGLKNLLRIGLHYPAGVDQVVRFAPALKLGIVGCGGAAGRLHLPALRHVHEIEVVGLADIDQPRLDALAERFGINVVYSDYRRLLDDPDIDAVAVCVPPELHLDLSFAVLDANKHLFVEKPLALSLPDCDRLIARASESRLKST